MEDKNPELRQSSLDLRMLGEFATVSPYQRFRQVIVAGLSQSASDRQMWQGIQVYRRNIDFLQLHNAGHQYELLDDLLGRDIRMSGIIANITDARQHEMLVASGLPVVDVSGVTGQREFPVLEPDHFAIGQEAGRFLLERGFRRIVFLATSGLDFEDQRWAGLVDVLRSAGGEVIWISAAKAEVLDMDRNPVPREKEICKISTWPLWIRKPFAVLGAYDGVAATVCDLMLQYQIPVPEQVVVMGIDDAREVCENTIPPITSVSIPGHQIGYDATELLTQMMDGEAMDQLIVSKKYAPLGVHARQSTEGLGIEDDYLGRAVAFMRERAKERLSMDEIAENCHMHRRTLERKFQEHLGRSPLHELFRIRVEIAKRRLLDTDASIYTTAIESGFRDAESMAQQFKKWLGMTPSAYRKQFRVG